MAMNKKAQAGYFYMMMIGITMFIIGFALSTALIKNNTDVRTNLDCDNSSISVDKKVSCGVIDIAAPFFTGIVFGLAGLAFSSKFIIG